MDQARRVAAIDCGTNSIRLLISDVTPGVGVLAMEDVERDMVITRLGQGVDRTGRLDPEAIARTLAAAELYQDRINAAGVSAMRVAATSATRDASNRRLFVDGMAEITGVTPEVISGSEEAELSFIGAISSLPSALEPPYLVVDIGGGSTEFVLGTTSVESSVSIDMGSVRVTERFGPEPWSPDKLAAARAWIDQRVEEAAEVVDLRAAHTVVGVAGTVTSLAALIRGVTEYDPTLTHGYQPSGEQWKEAMDFLIHASVLEKGSLPAMPPGRADVIAGGALVWERVLGYLGVVDVPSIDGGGRPTHAGDTSPLSRTTPTVVVSEHDILDGLALSLAGQPH